MSNDHQETHPLGPTNHHHHHQPSSSTLLTTKPLPHTPSPISPTTITTTETTSTPESRLAAALGRALLNIPPLSFQEAAATTTTTTTPPKVPTNNPLRRTLSDSYNNEQTPKTETKNPLRRTLSDTSEYQQPQKAPRVSLSPQSSTGKQTPKSEIVLKKVEDMVKEIEQRCWEIMREQEHVEEEVPQPQEQEECVGVERMKNGDLRFELSCSCSKRFEMLIKHNGYCFYRLT